jgi:hypothetical protein
MMVYMELGLPVGGSTATLSAIAGGARGRVVRRGVERHDLLVKALNDQARAVGLAEGVEPQESLLRDDPLSAGTPWPAPTSARTTPPTGPWR